MEANWDDLKVVLAVWRAGSLTLGAEALGIDQSTCSRRLSAIEAGLGFILFLRTRSGVSLTEAGEVVVRRASEIERRMALMDEELAQGPDGPAGTVRLLGPAWALDRLAGRAAQRLLAPHPKLELRLIPGRPATGFRADPSMGLWFEAAPRDGEFAIKLCEVPYAFYRAQGHDTDGLPWVSFGDEDASHMAHVRTLERVRRKRERVRLGSADERILLGAIGAGVGKGLLPMCLGAERPDLVRLDEGPPELVRVLHLHLHPDTVQTQRVQAVTRWLRETVPDLFGYS